ncbi:hypothetical protein AB0G71_22365 [Streptomyces sp. NPDC020403]|uniref:hypothetical protein n=1 Tax=unclassified Streptomyces TaxID=2593676 RepID=UPI0033F32922
MSPSSPSCSGLPAGCRGRRQREPYAHLLKQLARLYPATAAAADQGSTLPAAPAAAAPCAPAAPVLPASEAPVPTTVAAPVPATAAALQLTAEALGETYFRDHGRRAHGLEVELTDLLDLQFRLKARRGCRRRVLSEALDRGAVSAVHAGFPFTSA